MDEFEFFFGKEWSDGLPVVPPTEARIAAMLKGARRDPEEALGQVPPGLAEATVRSVAVHAVMAGCKPEYLPVLLAGVEAVLDPAFNIAGVQATLAPAAPLLIVNGPYARKIGLHGGLGCFGPGFRANATIGRALRLILMNLGAGLPGITAMSSFSHPARFTYCIAENEAESPWEALSVTRGFGPGENVATAVAAEGPVMVWDDASASPDRLLPPVAEVMSHLGCWNVWASTDQVVALTPQQAAICTKAGLGKADVHRRLCGLAGRTVRELKRGGQFRPSRIADFPFPVDLEDDDLWVPTVKEPERLLVIVAGGVPGPMTAVMHGWNGTSRIVSRAFEG
ncbi:MAG: hypothetical protein HYZ11_09270 [Candidatus Tectomicrobia bacterium]|uniref:Thioredoxin n=1 Tax=Tectimicrobiota bacterium TaxID=2528274 RepID=A0A932MML4_UNCTE|nr:hypothetical protein [Candidatus Tectomicrobia bacterium]